MNCSFPTSMKKQGPRLWNLSDAISQWNGLLYSWDLDKGSGQGVVKAVVLEVKDLSWSWMSFRAADKSKNCVQALQERLDRC